MESWLIVALVAFIVVGPKKLPSVVRKVARYIGKIQRMSDGFKRQLMDLDREIEKEVRSSD